jgi:hypothetical protein
MPCSRIRRRFSFDRANKTLQLGFGISPCVLWRKRRAWIAAFHVASWMSVSVQNAQFIGDATNIGYGHRRA